MRKILIADDSADLAEFLSDLMRLRNYDVRTTFIREEIFETLDVFKPDLVLLDVKLFLEDGRMICKEIKSNPLYTQIPIILLSANPALLEDYQQFLANDVIQKPFDIQALDGVIKKQFS